MNQRRLFFWVLSSALAGFLFGFDAVVISGAEKTIQELWDLNDSQHGWAVAAALWGTVVGSLLGGVPSDRFGRKKTLMTIGVLYLISSIWSALAGGLSTFIIARFLGGLGVGVSTVVGPMYISEIAPAEKRGRLAGLFQFNIVFGVFIAFFSNALFGNILGESAWRWMLGIEALPAIIYVFLCFTIPESPRWLISKKGDREGGKKILRMARENASEEELEKLVCEIEEGSGTVEKKAFSLSRLKVSLMLAFLIAFFNQLSGINVILYFAPRLLGLAGIDNPLMASISLGIVNLAFTFVGLWLIDRLGRKQLLLIGSFGYIISLGICAWAFLSMPAFKVVSSAIDLEGAAAKVEKLATANRTVSKEEKAQAQNQFKEAKVKLASVTAIDGYEGEVASEVDALSTEQAKELASSTKEEASKILGGKSTLVLLLSLIHI